MHKLTFKMPVYLPVMQYAQSSALRETLYKAHVTRASDQAPPAQNDQDNTPIMRELLALRAEEAQLLGFAHYAALSIHPKMAESSADVLRFLSDLADRAKPFAMRDVAANKPLIGDLVSFGELWSPKAAYSCSSESFGETCGLRNL